VARDAGTAEADGTAPWLVVVDPQRIFADPASDWFSPFFPAAIERIRALAEHIGPQRTLVTRWLPTADRSTSWGDYFAAWPFADVSATHPLYDLMPEVVGLSARDTIDEPTFSKWGPQLEGIVGRGARIWLTGVSTDCCVLSTALGAADAGARITVVADACAASSAEDGAAALQVMGLYPPQIEVMESAQLLW
jgi:nicotinamidase-related amidase